MLDVLKSGTSIRELEKSVESKLNFIEDISPELFSISLESKLIELSLVVVPLLNYVIATVFYRWLLCVSTKFSICLYPIKLLLLLAFAF